MLMMGVDSARESMVSMLLAHVDDDDDISLGKRQRKYMNILKELADLVCLEIMVTQCI